VHRDRGLLEERITRELWERVLPLVESERSPLSITAGPTRDDQTPFEVGCDVGCTVDDDVVHVPRHVPEGWADRRVEAVIDLGFRGDPAGFQCEG
jgi:alpha-mannosidase